MGASLRNKVVLVTGASAGIGAATAMEFAKLGARILLCARRLDKLKAMEPELMKAGAAAVLSFELDVSNRDDVEGTIHTLPEAWSDIDVLVNNAGLSRGLKKLYEDDTEDWEEMIDTNVKGLLYVTRAVVPGMVKRNRGMSSISDRLPDTWLTPTVACIARRKPRSDLSAMVCGST